MDKDMLYNLANKPASETDATSYSLNNQTNITSKRIEKKANVTILVVEDHPELRQFLCDELSLYFNVINAAEGNQALELASERIPDLILSDVMMPGMDGNEFCMRLKNDELTSHIPVILLTALSSDEHQIIGLEKGADDYITKPFNTDILLLRIHNQLEMRRKLRERYGKGLGIESKDVAVNSVDEQFLTKAIASIEKYMENENFSVEDFSSEMAMSRSQLYRKVEALTNLSPSMFINNIRIKRAAQLIKQKAGNINEIMLMVGFNNASYFSKKFKDIYGKTPSEYSNEY
jgi:DNA-binding response OmpR family regulator